MLGKKTLLEEIDKALEDHKAWIEEIRRVRKGYTTPFSMPQDESRCAFGKWLKEDGRSLKKIPGFEILELIGKYHMLVHEEYAKIYRLCYGTGGFLSKLLGTARKLRYDEKEELKRIYKELLRHSRMLRKKLIVLKQLVEAIDERYLKEL